MSALWGGTLVTLLGCSFVACARQALLLTSQETEQLTGSLLEGSSIDGVPSMKPPAWGNPFRRPPSITHELPAVLDSVARHLRLGSSLRQALEQTNAAGLLGQQLDALNDDLAMGTSLATAIDRWREDADEPIIDLVAGSLQLSVKAGGSVASAVEQVAATVRDRASVASEVHALAAQAQRSAIVIALMPVGFVAITALSDPDSTRFLIDSPLGRTCVLAGVGFDALGLWWMRKIVRSIQW